MKTKLHEEQRGYKLPEPDKYNNGFPPLVNKIATGAVIFYFAVLTAVVSRAIIIGAINTFGG